MILQEDGFCELYSIANDPAEMKNLANETAYATTLTQLRGDLFAEMARVNDTGERQSRLIDAARNA